MRVAVTGATGFVGSSVVRRLAREGHDVHVLTRSGSNPARLVDVHERLTFHVVDLRDTKTLTAIVEAIAPTELYHLAGTAIVGGVEPSAEASRGNVSITAAVVRAAASLACSVVTTGDAFECPSTGRPLTELDGARDVATGVHGASTRAATEIAHAIGAASGTPVATVRLFSVHGPDDDPRRLLPRLVDAARGGNPVQLSDPEIVRDWVAVEDVAGLYQEAAHAGPVDGPRVFNAASGRAVTLGELVDIVGATVGRRVDASWGGYPVAAHDRGYWVGDPTYTRTQLGWAPRDSVEDGLRRTIAALGNT